MNVMRPTATLAIPRQASRSHSHRWQRSHARQRRTVDEPYRVAVSPSPEINRQRFARFVARVLSDARDRGLNDRDITNATTISASTFHRWQRGDFATTPDVGKITAFCEGLGVPTRSALLALGAEEGRDDPAPEPALDPEIRKIQRALADPNVSDQEKVIIREMLKMVAGRITNHRRG